MWRKGCVVIWVCEDMLAVYRLDLALVGVRVRFLNALSCQFRRSRSLGLVFARLK